MYKQRKLLGPCGEESLPFGVERKTPERIHGIFRDQPWEEKRKLIETLLRETDFEEFFENWDDRLVVGQIGWVACALAAVLNDIEIKRGVDFGVSGQMMDAGIVLVYNASAVNKDWNPGKE